MAAALTTASYSFTDEEVSRLAKCDDQPEFLLLYRRLLQSKGVEDIREMGKTPETPNPKQKPSQVKLVIFTQVKNKK